MNTPLPTTTKYQGLEGEDPTAPFWGSGNYVGPYWSNGSVQSSVEWGDKPPLNALDALARQHDAAYAHFKDAAHREAADMIFAENANKLKEKYGPKLADNPKFAAAMVQYGNYTARKATNLVKSGMFVPGLAPLAVLKYGYEHVKEFTGRIKGTHLKNELADVKSFYEKDTGAKPLEVLKTTSLVANGRGSKAPVNAKGKALLEAGERAAKKLGKFISSHTKNSNVVLPTTVTNSSPEVRPAEPTLQERQAARFANYKALHDAALASENRPRVYHPPKRNLDKALSKSYRKKRDAQRKLRKIKVRPL